MPPAVRHTKLYGLYNILYTKLYMIPNKIPKRYTLHHNTCYALHHRLPLTAAPSPSPPRWTQPSPPALRSEDRKRQLGERLSWRTPTGAVAKERKGREGYVSDLCERMKEGAKWEGSTLAVIAKDGGRELCVSLLYERMRMRTKWEGRTWEAITEDRGKELCVRGHCERMKRERRE